MIDSELKLNFDLKTYQHRPPFAMNWTEPIEFAHKIMIPQAEYSINYSSAAAAGNGNIVIPSETSTASQPRNTNTSRKGQQDADGVVITPDPSEIVIKTRLMKEKQNHFSFDDDYSDDSYIPPSLSSIYAGSQKNAGETRSADIGDNKGKDDTKVFLNICTHPLIAVPGQRKGLDEQTGKEIDGWRLPMSMGDLCPCYDRLGNAAIVAD